jgi:hypothetical protein
MKYLKTYDNYNYQLGQYVKTKEEYCVGDDSDGRWVWDDKFKIVNIAKINLSQGYIKKYLLESWLDLHISLAESNIKGYLSDKEIEEFELKKSASQYNL